MGNRVLHILSSRLYSGAENVVCQIIDTLQQDIEMAYCSPDGPIKETLQDKGIDFLPIEKMSFTEINKAIKLYKPDIIHAHDIRASIMAAHFSDEIQVISHIHCNFKEMSRLSWKSILYRLYINKFSHIFVVSKSITKEYYFSSVMSRKSSVLYNVVNEQRLKENLHVNLKDAEFDFIYLGRFDDQKNPIRLIGIIEGIIKILPNAKFVLIGNGPLLEESQNLARRLNIHNNIRFTGYLKNPIHYLKSSKVMLMSSRSEGTPMCVLEAMLFGIPIVSTGVDGIKELIQNGTDGYYYDTDEEIVKAACHLIINEKDRRNQSINVYNKAVKINDIQQYKENLLSVYNRLLENNDKKVVR